VKVTKSPADGTADGGARVGGRLELEHPRGSEDRMMDTGGDRGEGEGERLIDAARSWLWGLSEKAEEACAAPLNRARDYSYPLPVL